MSESDARRSVLVVEDERDILAVVCEILEADGLAVVSATDGKQALGTLERFQPDVILTDLMMPVMDGLAFISAYRQRGGPHAPIIAMSAFPAYLRKVKELGAATFLLKPFTIEELLETVGKVLAGRVEVLSATPPPPPVIEDELTRLQMVARQGLQVPTDDPRLRWYVERVASLFEVPVCAISVVGEQAQNLQQLFCATDLLRPDARTPREDAFCTHAVVARAALVVQDTSENPFFKDNSVVRSIGIRFYAGVPLLTRKGDPAGTLCLMDQAARPFTYFDLELLSLLSRRVVAAIERRHHDAHPDEPESAYQYLASVDEELGVFARGAFVDLMVVLASRATERRRPFTIVGVHATPSALRGLVATCEAAFGTALVGRLGARSLGVLIPDVTRQDAERTLGALKLDAELLFAAVPAYPAAAHDALQAIEIIDSDEARPPWQPGALESGV